MASPPPLPRFTLILPAGGSSTRFGSNKLLAMLAGQPVIARTLGCFLDHPSLAEVVIAAAMPDPIRQACAPQLEAAVQRGVPVTFAPGGATRAESVINALSLTPPDVEWIAVHDAARPLLSRDLLSQTLAAAMEYGAATPAMPVTLTIKETTAQTLPARVSRTIPRQTLFAVQTPQVSRRAAFLEAVQMCALPLEQVTDDLQLLELAGIPTFLIAGEQRNLKLTTAADLLAAEAILGAEGDS